MEIPSGVSGFYNSAEQKPPEMDVREYKGLCYGLAQDLGGEVLEFVDSLYPANFYKADFEMPSGPVSLVMNKHYPILAFATAVDAVKIEFIDYPFGIEPLPEGYTVLPAAALDVPVPGSLDKLPSNQLNEGEIEQIKYWKPESVGQILFNFWD